MTDGIKRIIKWYAFTWQGIPYQETINKKELWHKNLKEICKVFVQFSKQNIWNEKDWVFLHENSTQQ